MAMVAVIGACTALFAARIGLFQTDLKKVLAYSTVSQLGFMFIGVGVGAFAAGFFHVFTHAFFKACLFLGAGSVIHAMHARIHDTDASQDMRNMGGLRKLHAHHARGRSSSRASPSPACPPLLRLLVQGRDPLEGLLDPRRRRNRGSAARACGPGPTGSARRSHWVGHRRRDDDAFYMFRAYFMTFHGEFRGLEDRQGLEGAPATRLTTTTSTRTTRARSRAPRRTSRRWR